MPRPNGPNGSGSVGGHAAAVAPSPAASAATAASAHSAETSHFTHGSVRRGGRACDEGWMPARLARSVLAAARRHPRMVGAAQLAAVAIFIGFAIWAISGEIGPASDRL